MQCPKSIKYDPASRLKKSRFNSEVVRFSKNKIYQRAKFCQNPAATFAVLMLTQRGHKTNG